MKWLKPAEEQRPGYSVYTAAGQSPRTYLAQKRRGGSGLWLLAVRRNEGEPLRIILGANTLAECKTYAEKYEAEQ